MNILIRLVHVLVFIAPFYLVSFVLGSTWQALIDGWESGRRATSDDYRRLAEKGRSGDGRSFRMSFLVERNA